MVFAALIFSCFLIADTAGAISRERISPQEALSLILGKAIPARPTPGTTVESSYRSFRADGTYEVSFESGFDRGHYAIDDSRICVSTTASNHCFAFYRIDNDTIVMVERESGAENYISISSLNTSRGG